MRQFVLAGSLLCGIVAALWFVLFAGTSPAELLQSARRAQRQGRFAAAEQLARQCLGDPAVEVDAALLAAQCALEQLSADRAVGYLRRLEQNSSAQTLPAHLMRARLLYRSQCRLSEAEAAYRTVLDIDPAHLAANEELARLLATCGRRNEAIPFALRVLQADDNDLRVLLARESGVIHDPELLQKCRLAAPDDPLPLFGLAKYAAAEGQTDQAIPLLRQSLAIDPRFAPAWAALGERLVAAHRIDELAAWLVDVPPEADQFAATWRGRGQFAEQTGQNDAAIRCYWESLLRAPESRQATYHLAGLLARSGQTQAAGVLEERQRQLARLESAQDRPLFSSQQAGLSEILELIRCYRDAGRIREALVWARLARQADPRSADVAALWSKLSTKAAELPLQLTAPSHNPALALDFSDYPLPVADKHSLPAVAEPEPGDTLIRFRSEAAERGLDFTFRYGATSPPLLRMYEFTGGGIGVVDADLDGFPDVFLTQGGEGPYPDSTDRAGDQLFRNLAGERFANVTSRTRISGTRFGQGTAVGDFDGDGFADIYVANIGPNRLWRNNGDGTFSPQDDAFPADEAWTTSCLMADLNGDALPDLYDVNYLTGEDVFEKTCRNSDGSTAMCMPFDFDGATDRLMLNDGRGRFVDVTATAFSSPPDGKGLGIIAWDESGNGQLEVLVANDTTPNAFLSRHHDTATFTLDDSSIASGIGFNSDGKAEGCMGIALGDVNGDGRLDVHVTNFLAESNTLYVADSQPGYFLDRTRKLGLHEPTWNVLGFGTQFLDADLDGQLELFVTNGHLQDLRRFDRPFRMPPQLFGIRGGRAELLPAAQVGPYFEQQWRGRSAARLDWNRDGREDLLVGHLDDPTVLLTNTSPEPGHAFSLRLVGTASPRDGTGATVRIRVGDRWQVRQITAGDGYQASNEKRVLFGTGKANVADELLIRWPTGTTQRFEDVRAESSLLIVEGIGEALPVP